MKILRSAFLIIVFLLILTASVLAVDTVELHVAKNGSDYNSGAYDKPLATLEGAKMKAATYKGKKSVRVFFHEGEYRFFDSVKFDEFYSGSKNYPVSFEAYNNDKVTFKGSDDLDIKKFKKVTDEKILEKIPQIARDNVICTDLSEAGIKRIPRLSELDGFAEKRVNYVSLYYNGEKCTLSEWPNGDFNFDSFKTVITIGENGYSATPGPTFRYEDNRGRNWTTADQPYVTGFLGIDYGYDRQLVEKVDSSNKSITLAHGLLYGISDTGTNRWKIHNLIEELDMPGEWYIDQPTNILYFYPVKELSEEDILSLSSYQEPFVEFNSESNSTGVGPWNHSYYITFKNISFEQSGGDAVRGLGANITFDGCTFKNIGGNALKLNGVNQSIRNCKFLDIGSCAVEIYDDKGWIPKESDGTVIENNYIYNAGIETLRANIYITGTKCLVKNNTIQMSKNQAILYTGSYIRLMNNEILNATREVADAGTIYTGYKYGDVGNEIGYNIIHDYYCVSKQNGSQGVWGIYQDDQNSTNHIHHNILFNGGAGAILIGGGQDHIIDNNIIFNAGYYGSIYCDNRGETWTSFAEKMKTGEEAYQKLYRPLFAEKFPYLWNRIKYSTHPKNNSVIDNIVSIPISMAKSALQLGRLENNTETKDVSIFVDPENNDYRLKNSSAVAELHKDALTESSFSLDNVGCSKKVISDIESMHFKKTLPYNKEENVDGSKLEFVWTRPYMADSYILRIASDPEMKNIVKEMEVPYNYVEVNGLKSGEVTYYWTVEAVCKGVNFNNKWYGDEVYSFTTSLYDIVDIEGAQSELLNVKSYMDSIDVSKYYKANVQATNEAISSVTELTKKKYGEITKSELDNALEKMNQEFSKLKKARIITPTKLDDKYFENLDNWKWCHASADVTLENKELKITNTAPYLDGSTLLYIKEPIGENTVYAFDMKIDFNDSGYNPQLQWVGLYTYLQSPEQNIWDVGNHGYLCVLKRYKTESQRYPGGIIEQTADTNVVSGKWQRYYFGVVEEPDSKRLILRIDDKIYYDTVDNSETQKSGYLEFLIPNTCTVTIRQIDGEINDNFEDLKKITYITSESEGLVEKTDNFIKYESQCEKSSGIMLKNGEPGNVTYKVTPGKGKNKLYLWHDMDVDGNKTANVQIKLDHVRFREGEEEYVNKTVDFTSESDWLCLGEYEVPNGDIYITLSSDGSGSINTSAVKLEGSD